VSVLLPKRKLSDRKRDAILEAAMQAFRENGFEFANMDAISDSAGVSKRTVYRHFGSKDELFEAVFGRLLERCSEHNVQAQFSSEPLGRQLMRYCQAKVNAMANDPSWLALFRMALSTFAQNPALAGRTLQASQTEDERLTAWFRAAAESGRLHVPHPGRTSRLFWSIASGAVLLPRVIGLAGDDATQDAMLKELVDLFLFRYAPRGQRAAAELAAPRPQKRLIRPL
jgi:TetR/AcrR family transcriptional regulator of autoinduction and epiphytic fitness